MDPPKNVRFLGIVDRDSMNEIFNMADMFFLPSYQELFPMTVLEAFNCKIPVLLRNLDIYPDIYFDFYIKGNSINDYIRNIINLKKNKNESRNWQERSWKGHLFYSEERVINLWKQFYDNIYFTAKARRIFRQ